MKLALEAVERQIYKVLEKQAKLREQSPSSSGRCEPGPRRGPLPSATSGLQDIHPKPLLSPLCDGMPGTLGAAAAEDSNQAPDEDFSPSATSGLQDLHPEPLLSPPRDKMPRTLGEAAAEDASQAPSEDLSPLPPPVFKISTRNRFSPLRATECHEHWVLQQRKTRARPRARTSPPLPPSVFKISTLTHFSPLHVTECHEHWEQQQWKT
ncbi:hypothetical protein Q8A67_017272 [Cirrhinus molitorella]|uniref:Uncharacterized protein n=1 Tax=Cirrhinus molitorella TaxID=172907 RepID=A0AA88PHM9_9TELE|nr:hypothetical protein Q8A67_017272 [Cirrhinus molitorella]